MTLSFGNYLANQYPDNPVIRLQAFYTTQGVKEACQYIDKNTQLRELENRQLNPLEKLAIEVLIAGAGFVDASQALHGYQNEIFPKGFS